MTVNNGDTFQDSDRFQTAAVVEGTHTNGSNATGYGYFGKASASIKGIVPNIGDIFRNSDSAEAAATYKSVIVNIDDAFRDRNRVKVAAVIEGILSNASNTFRNDYRGQSAAIFEYIVPDAGYVQIVWNDQIPTGTMVRY
jgi:hypothetical protein